MSVSFSTAIGVDDALPYSKKRAVPSCRKIFIHGMNFAPEPIGIGRYTDELAAYLAAQGESIEVVTSLPHYPGWTIRPPYRAWRYVLENRTGIQLSVALSFFIQVDAEFGGLWRHLEIGRAHV